MKSAAVKGAVRVVLAGLTSLAAFGGARISSDMPASTPSGTVDIIVQFKTKPTAEALNQVLAAGEIKRQYRAIPAVHMTVPVSMIGRIASNPLVVYVSPDRTTTVRSTSPRKPSTRINSGHPVSTGPASG
jgi:hypothetical protein